MYVLHKTRSAAAGTPAPSSARWSRCSPPASSGGSKSSPNAGGLDPMACAEAVREIARRQGLAAKVASVSGDDLSGRIAELRGRGDLRAPRHRRAVARDGRCGDGERLPRRRARSPPRSMPAPMSWSPAGSPTRRWWSGPASGPSAGAPSDLDALAGAVVAGHIIECGAQCAGGNYAFFEEIKGLERCGFPLVELHPDGSSVVTKHPGHRRRTSPSARSPRSSSTRSRALATSAPMRWPASTRSDSATTGRTGCGCRA